jgi:SAM-dependent methyltransferase
MTGLDDRRRAIEVGEEQMSNASALVACSEIFADLRRSSCVRESLMSELARWNERFSAPGYHFGTEPNAFLKNQAHRLARGQRALAIADGEGRNGVFLAEQGLDVLSIDFSPPAQAKARELAKHRGVALRIEQADLVNWTWPTAQFDVVAAIFFQFCGPVERARIFAGIKQALTPGGLLLLQGYRTEQLAYGTGGPKEIANLYTRALLEAEFSDFAKLEIHEHDDLVTEGTAHAGMSALIDLVGRK